MNCRLQLYCTRGGEGQGQKRRAEEASPDTPVLWQPWLPWTPASIDSIGG